MDADVALLSSYANYLSTWANAGDALVSNAQIIASQTTGAGLTAPTDAAQVVQIGNTIGSTAKINLYAAVLQQAANDLNQRLSGVVTPQLSGDASTLRAISSWLSSIDSNVSAAKAALTNLQSEEPSASVAIGNAIAEINSIYPAANLTPSVVAADLNRISQQISAIGAVPPTKAPPSSAPAQTTSSSSGIILGSIALAAAVGLWAAGRKKYMRSRRSA